MSKSIIDEFLNESAVRTGHAGISIYEPATGKYLYNYNADKNFLPSSNVKLFTLYAGLKYLGDSLPGIKVIEGDSSIEVFPTGDPTLLHPDFHQQHIIEYLSANEKRISISFPLLNTGVYGQGWAWDDFSEDFMQERSVMPVYGNLVTFSGTEYSYQYFPKIISRSKIAFPYFDETNNSNAFIAEGKRERNSNIFLLRTGGSKEKKISVPFAVIDSSVARLISDTIHKHVYYAPSLRLSNYFASLLKTIYSRPVDSLFRPMMFNSDNFFAEQTLLMVSNEKLGYMTDAAMIDTLLKNDFADIPTKPRWVDGSGLSRYNLFSPKDFIYILNKLKNDFGWERIKNILPAGGQGTLTGYYESEQAAIHAKTGSMSNNVSLSGYLITKKNHSLLFSVIINNFSGNGKEGRRAIEKLIREIRERY